MTKRLLVAVLLLAGTALPASAGSITIDSTNCLSGGPGSCYGLVWTLNVVAGTFVDASETFGYSATLTVADDPLVSGTATQTISAVVFKATTSVNDHELFSAPTGTGPWITVLNGLSTSGCEGSGLGFICSSTVGTEAITGSTPLQWVWYFDSDDPSI